MEYVVTASYHGLETVDYWALEGKRRRYAAGLQSLLDRAWLELELEPLGSFACSQYGDTDAEFRVTAGDRPPSADEWRDRRLVRLEGVLVLHTTVGGAPVWSFRQASLTVWSRQTGEASTFELEPGHARLVLARIVSEIAARFLRTCAPRRDWADMVTPWDERGHQGAIEDARATLAWAGLAPGEENEGAEGEVA